MNLPRLGLALVALLCALCAADATATCPSAGSSTNISCIAGGSFTGTPSAALVNGGLCTCQCGANSDYDYASSVGSTTQFVASGSAACTAANCTTNFPTFCAASSGSVTAVFLTAAEANAAQTPVPKVAGMNAICASLTASCRVPTASAPNPCPSFLTSGTVTQYFAITPISPATAAQTCALTLVALAAKGVTVTALCASNNCNAPAAASAAAAAMPAKALLAAAVVALAAAAL